VAGIPCPNCGKPCLPGAPVCRWCKSKIPASVRPAAEIQRSPEHRAELQEIKEWEGRANDRPDPPLSVRTWSALVVAAAGLGTVLLTTERQFEIRTPAIFIGGVAAVVALAFGFHDLSAFRRRDRRRPEDPAMIFLLRMKSKQWSLARRVLADYPSAESRHANVAQLWKEQLGASIEVTGVSVSNVEVLGDDAATVTVAVHLRSASAVGCLFFGILGALLFAKRDVRRFDKLVLRRNDRWYLVNGLPEDRTDRRLIRDLGVVE
jgi:hypothetical protein